MKDKIISLESPNSSIAEIYRSIRTNVEYSNLDKDIKIINVTSSIANEAKTTTTANLAVTFAKKYKKVLVIDMDIRKASLHKLFHVKNEFGLTDLLLDFSKNRENVDLSKYFQTIKNGEFVNDLTIITAGYEIANPTEVLGAKLVKELLTFLKDQFDIILIDSSPCGIIPDGLVVSKQSEGTIFVVESGNAKIDYVQDIIKQFNHFKINILGVILTKSKVLDRNYGSYYGYYGSSNGNHINF